MRQFLLTLVLLIFVGSVAALISDDFRRGITGILAVFGVLLGLGTLIWGMSASYRQSEDTVMICEKDRSRGDNGSSYRVYTSNGVYALKDSFIGGVRFNTADFYSMLQEGQVYQIEAKGTRIPFLSWFPNMLEADKQPEGTAFSGSC